MQLQLGLTFGLSAQVLCFRTLHSHVALIWISLHNTNLKHVSKWHIFQNGTQCQSKTCFKMAHVSEQHTTHAQLMAGSNWSHCQLEIVQSLVYLSWGETWARCLFPHMCKSRFSFSVCNIAVQSQFQSRRWKSTLICIVEMWTNADLVHVFWWKTTVVIYT